MVSDALVRVLVAWWLACATAEAHAQVVVCWRWCIHAEVQDSSSGARCLVSCGEVTKLPRRHASSDRRAPQGVILGLDAVRQCQLEWRHLPPCRGAEPSRFTRVERR
jgi:hypothetical protein